MAFLTHAHLDHSGMMPWIAGKHAPPAVMTKPTWQMGELLAYDSIKVAKAEGYPLQYGHDAVRALEDTLSLARYRDRFDVGGMEVKLHSAGHIPGSTMYEVRGSRTMLFTGDLNTSDSSLVWGAHPVKCDTLVMEGTYGGREHPDREQTRKRFVQRCKEVAEGGGTVLVPAFAVGRTQELMVLLADSGLQVWVDGMGRDVTTILQENPTFLRQPKELERAARVANIVNGPQARKQALEADVIISTSGMLEGGPALTYLDALHDEPGNAVFFTGFQVPGTNGRRLRDEGLIDIQGVVERVQCQIEAFDFSAHAGHSELVAFARACQPEEVVIMHSDHREVLRDALQGFCKVLLPETGQDVELGQG
jgi:putative mRNA 3-end processing factor